MLRATFLGLFTGLIAFVIYVAYYTGYFKAVTLTEGPAGPFRLLGKEHVGPYHKIVPIIEEVEAFAKEKGLDCTRSFGLYLDDPKATEEIRLRSRGGCVLPAEASLDGVTLPEGVALTEYPAGDFVIAHFDGSPGIGPFKAYPAAMERIQEKRYAFEGWNVLEVYEVGGPKDVKTIYYFPLLGGLQALPE